MTIRSRASQILDMGCFTMTRETGFKYFDIPTTFDSLLELKLLELNSFSIAENKVCTTVALRYRIISLGELS